MITAVDTNVLVDVLWDDPEYAARSQAALSQRRSEGRLVACEIVWAELFAAAPSSASLLSAMEEIGVEFSAVGVAAAEAAGYAWREYRARGGTRDRLIADFVVRAHALCQAERLLTRDRGHARTYLPELVILDPAE